MSQRPSKGIRAGAMLIGVAICQIISQAGWVSPAPAQSSETGAPQRYSMQRCIATTIENSRKIREAALDVDVADAQVKEAWSNVFPTIDGVATYTRNLTDQKIFLPDFGDTTGQANPIPIKISSDNNWLATFALDQPLFQAEIFIGVGAASRFRDLSRETLRGEQQVVVTNARRAFYDLMLVQESVRLIEESIRRVTSTLEEAQAMQRTGLGSDYDVLRIDVQLGNLSPNLRRAENAVDFARRVLNVTMGIDVEAPVEVEGSLRQVNILEPDANDAMHAALLQQTGLRLTVPVDPADTEEIWQLAQHQRTDLRQIALTEKLNRTQLSFERASYYPRLYAFANYQLTAQEDGSLDFFGENEFQRNSHWAAGVRLELPIFQGGGRPARVAQRKVQIEKTQTMTMELEQIALGQIRTALESVEEARLRTESQRRAVQQAERGFQIASLEFGEGTGSQLQVTDAEDALRQSEFNYAEAIYDYLISRAVLDLAAGIVPGVDDSQRPGAPEEQLP